MRSISRIAIAALALAACSPAPPAMDPPPAADPFAALAGSWSGVLEYSDYRNGNPVQLPTRVTAAASEQGRTLTLDYAYTEPSGQPVTSSGVHRLDLGAGRYVMEDDTLDVGMIEGFTGAGGSMVLTGTEQENNRPEPVRHTFTLRGDTLTVLKETRTPLQFRNQYRLVRVPAP